MLLFWFCPFFLSIHPHSYLLCCPPLNPPSFTFHFRALLLRSSFPVPSLHFRPLTFTRSGLSFSALILASPFLFFPLCFLLFLFRLLTLTLHVDFFSGCPLVSAMVLPYLFHFHFLGHWCLLSFRLTVPCHFYRFLPPMSPPISSSMSGFPNLISLWLSFQPRHLPLPPLICGSLAIEATIIAIMHLTSRNVYLFGTRSASHFTSDLYL